MGGKPHIIERREGRVFGWLGVQCPDCKGTGLMLRNDREVACVGCGGTGEAYGEITEKAE